jgi:hypothetical protein
LSYEKRAFQVKLKSEILLMTPPPPRAHLNLFKITDLVSPEAFPGRGFAALPIQDSGDNFIRIKDRQTAQQRDRILVGAWLRQRTARTLSCASAESSGS